MGAAVRLKRGSLAASPFLASGGVSAIQKLAGDPQFWGVGKLLRRVFGNMLWRREAQHPHTRHTVEKTKRAVNPYWADERG